MEIKNEKNNCNSPSPASYIFDLLYENTIYSVEIEKSVDKEESITFTSRNKDELSIYYYKKSLSLQNLTKISKVFRLCDNLDEAIDIFLQRFSLNKVKLFKNDKIFDLILEIQLPNDKNEEIKIPFDKIKIEDNNLVEKLCEKLVCLEDENKKLKKEINDLKIQMSKKKKVIT